MSTTFVDHTVDSAPERSRRAMTDVERRLGYLPSAIARIAESPTTLTGFLQSSGLFEQTSLQPVEREVVIMTVALRHGCELCVAMHTAKLTGLSASARLIDNLRHGIALEDPRLNGLQRFTSHLMDTHGAAEHLQLQAFLELGFTRQQALEVVLGIGAYTMSTLANRLTAAPVDPQLTMFAAPQAS